MNIGNCNNLLPEKKCGGCLSGKKKKGNREKTKPSFSGSSHVTGLENKTTPKGKNSRASSRQNGAQARNQREGNTIKVKKKREKKRPSTKLSRRKENVQESTDFGAK